MLKLRNIIPACFFLLAIFLLGNKNAVASNIKMTADGTCYINMIYWRPPNPAVSLSPIVPCNYTQDTVPQNQVAGMVCIVSISIDPITLQQVVEEEDCSEVIFQQSSRLQLPQRNFLPELSAKPDIPTLAFLEPRPARPALYVLLA